MKKIFFILVVILLIGCAPMIPNYVEYSQKLVNSQLLAKHYDYYLKTYGGTEKIGFYDEAYWGYYSILTASTLNIQYDLVMSALESDTTNNVLDHIPSIKNILTQHLYIYSEIWSKAISEHVKYEYFSVDFSTALAICKNEFKRMKTFDKVKKIKDQLKIKTNKLDKAKYPNTYEVYGLITQLISLTEKPTGSLLTFNQTVNSINIELDKVLALAELEY